MKSKFFFLLRYYLFWILLSVVAKAIFLVYQWQDTTTLEMNDILHIFGKGLLLDFSLGGYILMLSSLVMAFSSFLNPNFVRQIFSTLTAICLLFFSVVMTIDLELFKNWGYHIDTTPLMYLKTPKEALASTPLWLTIALILFAALFFIIAWKLYKTYILSYYRQGKKKMAEIPVFLLLGGLMLIPVRGGFDVAPLNSSFVFYHPTNMYANQAGINPVWNFIYELMHMKKLDKQYAYMPEADANELISECEETIGDYPRILKTNRPNIVFLLMESFTANAIEVLGGLPDVTPNINALAKEGILFDSIYATGCRSDRGMVAAISALPSNPSIALIKYPNKVARYPFFPKDLEKEGYSTCYYYAGDINFGSFRSYVTMSFQDMVTQDDFSGEAIKNRFKWGVHDEYMFQRLFDNISKAKQPFMHMAFNMSSHEPFTVPGEVAFEGNDLEHKFMNAIHYSDRCIGDFMKKCKESGIWDNTLFILMADHGTRHIKHVDPNLPDAYHIPLILTGGVLNVRDTVVHTIGSQTDMIATVLSQLGMDCSGYTYSRNLLADHKYPFAFYSYPNAVGLVSKDGVSVMHLKNEKFIVGDTLSENKKLLHAYLQKITTVLK